jgi:hypothetical protein
MTHFGLKFYVININLFVARGPSIFVTLEYSFRDGLSPISTVLGVHISIPMS